MVLEKKIKLGKAGDFWFSHDCLMKWLEKFNKSDTKRGNYIRNHTKNYPE